MHRVFVYGSLKSGYWNNRLLSDSVLEMTGRTAKKFRMYTNGAFPMIVPDKNGVEITGEVYLVSDEVLRNLDRLEGVPHHYVRDSVPVRDSSGRQVFAYVYVYSVDPAESEMGYAAVLSGEWSAVR